jgi:hypothetical protein
MHGNKPPAAEQHKSYLVYKSSQELDQKAQKHNRAAFQKIALATFSFLAYR